jgi:hypothetical protein
MSHTTKNLHLLRTHTQSGFIALMSAILLSAVLFTLTISLSSTTFSARTNALHSELKRQSIALAESCMHKALLAVTQNYTYSPHTGGDEVAIDSNKCTIASVLYETENITTHTKTVSVWTQANYHGAFTTMKAIVSIVNPYYIGAGVTPITIQSWKEATSTDI